MIEGTSHSGLVDPDAFRARVLSALTVLYPGHPFVAGEAPDAIRHGETTLSLEKLRHQLGSAVLAEPELQELVRRHFDPVLKGSGSTGYPAWDVARPLLRPQFILTRFADKRPFLAMPLDAELQVGIVVDENEIFRYVPKSQLEVWAVSWEQIYEAALENLDRAASGTSIGFSPPPDRMMVIETGDGYDAVRILLPGFRAFLAERLGTPFRFAIPNRDRLICWAEDNSRSFETFLGERLEREVREQPFPLVAKPYRASATGIVPWTTESLE